MIADVVNNLREINQFLMRLIGMRLGSHREHTHQRTRGSVEDRSLNGTIISVCRTLGNCSEHVTGRKRVLYSCECQRGLFTVVYRLVNSSCEVVWLDMTVFVIE